MENVRKHRDIKLITNAGRRNNWCQNQLSNYKVFHTKLISNRYKKNIFMNKPVSLGLSILELSKIVMHELWYNYVKPKYG